MKVLHVLDHSLPLFSGYSFRSQSIVHFQERLGITPLVLTSPKQGSSANECEKHAGITYYRTRPAQSPIALRIPFIGELTLMRQLACRIAEVVRREKINLIHSHSPVLNGLPALWVARRCKIPMVYEARAFWEDAAVDHGTTSEGSVRYRLTRALETFLFRHVDRVVTICEGMRAELVSRGITAEKIGVVPNGVDTEWFSPQPKSENLARALGLDGGPVFGFIGSFYHYEGLRFLVNTFTEIQREMPAARLLLVGAGSEEAHLRAIVGAAKTNVLFTGQVPHERIRDYYSVIDICVFPRMSMRLTELVTPLKPLEAMAMGKTVLASDVGGLRELIQHGHTGFLFPPDDPDALVGAAVKAGSDADLREKMGATARRFVKNQRSWPKIISQYRPLYNEILQGNSRHVETS